MNDKQNFSERYRNIIREKLFTDNEEKERKNEEANFPKNFAFNLEYQKIINSNDGESKITSELKKLIAFVREKNYYRDIKGNRITRKGELLPTPFQKLQKKNEEIKNYYENKINRKKSPLILKNYRNKNIYLDNNLKIFNSLGSTSKKKAKNYFSSKRYIKNAEILNLNKGFNNKGIQNNIKLTINNNITEPDGGLNKNERYKNTDHNLCTSDTFNVSKTKYFHDSVFNQINFWKTKIIYPKSLNKINNRENTYENDSKFSNYIIEYKKRNKENNLNNISGINKNKKNKNIKKNNIAFKFKTICKEKEFPNKDMNKYDLIQFNLKQLIKKDENNKGKIKINMRKTHKNFNFIKKENKTINVNLDSNNILHFYNNNI